MNTPLKLGGFTLGLAAVFGAAFGVGRWVDPDVAQATGSHGTHTGQGYVLSRIDVPGGEFGFKVTGPDGKAVTDYEIAHDKKLHLIVVRNDLSGFRHVHPELGADGVWRVASPLNGPGSYRAYADFKPVGGEAQVLPLDVTVPGAYKAKPLPAPSAHAKVDGYDVELSGALKAGGSGKLTLTVSRDGKQVTDLQPYLGAFGHLVALRSPDLNYSHVHPDGNTPGPVTFVAEAPTKGSYRLYFDFKHGDKVRTAEFTAVTGEAAAPTTEPEQHHGH